MTCISKVNICYVRCSHRNNARVLVIPVASCMERYWKTGFSQRLWVLNTQPFYFTTFWQLFLIRNVFSDAALKFVTQSVFLKHLETNPTFRVWSHPKNHNSFWSQFPRQPIDYMNITLTLSIIKYWIQKIETHWCSNCNDRHFTP